MELSHTYALLGEDNLAKDELRRVIVGEGEDLQQVVGYMRLASKDDQEYLQELYILKDIIKRKYTARIKRREAIRKLNFIIAITKNQEDLDRMLWYDLTEMIKVAKENNINIVLQTYPNDFSENRIFREVDKKYHIPLVDNSLIFKERLRTQKEEGLFVADGHCNAKGYKLIAENIYNTLVVEGLLNKYMSTSSNRLYKNAQ
jgi:hypothetical protein